MISISALLDDGRTGKMNMILCDEALRYLSACLPIFCHCCRSGPLYTVTTMTMTACGRQPAVAVAVRAMSNTILRIP